jgi:hypothetical protein
MRDLQRRPLQGRLTNDEPPDASDRMHVALGTIDRRGGGKNFAKSAKPWKIGNSRSSFPIEVL